MDRIKEVKCFAPWTNVKVTAQQELNVCCAYRFSPEQKTYNLNDNTITEFLDSDEVATIREHLANGEFAPGCSRCAVMEDNGLLSFRKIFAKQFREFYLVENMGKLMTLNLSVGSTCNLKCTMCSAYSSTTWNDEYLEIYGIQMPNRAVVPPDSIEEIKTLINDVRHIDILGGEPFIMKEDSVLPVLEHVVSQGRAHLVTVHIVTNATVFPDRDWWDCLQNFKEVELQLSIDGVGPHNDYIRFPSKWETIVEIMKQYQQYAKQLPNIRLGIGHTVSAFNIYYLEEFFIWCIKMRMPKPFLGKVHSPHHVALEVWSDEAREFIRTKLLSSRIPEVKAWASALDEKRNASFSDFVHYTNKHDSYRGVDFCKTFPELAPFFQKQQLIPLVPK